MLKKLLPILLLIANAVHAQNTKPESFAKIQVGLHGIDFSYENPIINNLSLDSGVGYGIGYFFDGSGGMDAITGSSYILYNKPSFFVKSEIKWNYDRKDRLAEGSSLKLNSANYVGLQFKYNFGANSPYYDKVLINDLHWGIQRSLGNRFLINSFIGIGYGYDFDYKIGKQILTFGLKFGYKTF